MAMSRRRFIYAVCVAVFLCNAAFLMHIRHIRPLWANIPPAPSETGARLFTLNDPELSYRINGLMLQNIGNSGGMMVPLAQYDYSRLGTWLFLQDALDPHSNFTPLLAAYYFGATRQDKDLTPVIDYLGTVGRRPEGEKWRWLAQAVYLARFRQNDLDKALELAYALAAIDVPGMPAWTKQMPAFILNAQGDKATALEVMTGILKDGAKKLDPAEVNFMRYYICERILTKTQAEGLELCAPGY